MKFSFRSKSPAIFLAVGALVVMLIIIFGLAKFFHHASLKTGMPPPVSVQIAQAQSSVWTDSLSVIGNLTATSGVDISSQVAGTVDSINFQSGQRVQKGDLLLSLESKNEQDIVQEDEAKVALAKVSFMRDAELLKSNAVSKSDYDTKYYDLAQAEAELAQAQVDLQHHEIRAPFTGNLGISEVNLGQYLSPGTPIVTLQQLTPLYVDFNIPETAYLNIAVGGIFSFQGNNSTGKIVAINSKADASTRLISVRGEIDNTDLKLLPGMFGLVILPTSKTQAVVSVPKTSLAYSPMGTSVFLVKDGVATERLVVVIASEQDQAFITGIQPKDQVVSLGTQGLYDGAVVKIVKEEN